MSWPIFSSSVIWRSSASTRCSISGVAKGLRGNAPVSGTTAFGTSAADAAKGLMHWAAIVNAKAESEMRMFTSDAEQAAQG